LEKFASNQKKAPPTKLKSEIGNFFIKICGPHFAKDELRDLCKETSEESKDTSYKASEKISGDSSFLKPIPQTLQRNSRKISKKTYSNNK